MEAQTTLKLSPAEFDLWRDALSLYARELHDAARNEGRAPSDRNASRTLEARARDLLAKVGR